jgi:hypothetical protein
LERYLFFVWQVFLDNGNGKGVSVGSREHYLDYNNQLKNKGGLASYGGKTVAVW